MFVHTIFTVATVFINPLPGVPSVFQYNLS